MMRVRAIVLIAVLSLLVNSCQGLQSNKRSHKNELDHVVESLLQTESATARRSGVGIAGMNPNNQVNTPDTNPVYVLPTDPESAPFGSYLNPQASVSPLQAAFGQYRSPSQVGNVNQMGGGADPTANANVVGGAGAPDGFFFLETKSTRSRSQVGILGMLQGAMSALGGGGHGGGGGAGGGGHAGGGGGGEGGGTQPSYLLPTDPNSAPYGKFLNPATNINPLNVNAQYAQGGAGGEGGGEAGGAAPGALVAGNVPIGAAAGSNPASGFPQFLEISAESGVAHQLSHVGDCQNCEYAK